ncbi:MAG: TolC family protein [Candidatus Omnitrophica bacterium]|nr:TolC family protein [Candidatus Omnitrophota bacterium]
MRASKIITGGAVLFFFLGQAVQAGEVLTWPDCIKEAAKNNSDLIAAREGLTATAAGETIAGSALWPQLTGNAGFRRSGDAFDGISGDEGTDEYSYGLGIQQVLFDGFKKINAVYTARETTRAARAGYRFTSTTVRLNLRTAFINLLKAQEFVKVSAEIVSIRRENLELIALRYRSGLEHEGALLTAQANVAQAEFEQDQARREVDVAQRQLSKEMGRGDFNPFSVSGEFAVSENVRQTPDFEKLIKDNPSLLQAAAEKNAAAFNLKSASGDRAPQIAGSLAVDKVGTAWPPRDEQWTAGVRVSLPLFEGGLRQAQVVQARALYRQAQARELSAHERVRAELAQAWARVQDALQAEAVQRKALAAAAKRAEIAAAQYSTGFINFDSWTIIEDNLVGAKRVYLSARASMLLAEAAWVQAAATPAAADTVPMD